MATSVWSFVKSFNGDKLLNFGQYAVLVLNRPIRLPHTFVTKIWDEACYRATADGGTDRWYEFVSQLKKESQLKHIHPDLVSGDFDSVKPETLQRCKEAGCNVVSTPDQDKTDFMKALEEIVKYSKDKINSIIVVVENSGRLDHIMSNLNTLYNPKLIFGSQSIQLFLLSTESLTWLLPAGSHTITISDKLVQAQATCGLIPLGAPCVVTTTGLKWNLNKDKIEFGGLISSCNTYDKTFSGVVTVETDCPLLWTMNILFEEF